METYQHQVVFSATKGNFKISNDLYFINFYRIGHLASYILLLVILFCVTPYTYLILLNLLIVQKYFASMIKTTDVSAITSIVDLVLRDINDCHLQQNSFSHFCPVLSSQLQLGLETKRLIQFFPFIPHVHLGVSKNDQRFSILETKS